MKKGYFTFYYKRNIVKLRGDDIVIISINGMDNSGKTTQSKILTSEFPEIFVRRLHINEMSSFDKEKCNFDWWFSSSNAEEFVNTIYKCLEERIKIAKELNRDNNVIILEKGLDFYDVRVLATLVSKGYTLEQAARVRKQIRQKYDLEDVEEIKIYLKPGNYEREEFMLSTQKVFYNQYLSINYLLLKVANYDYKYIETDTIDNVTKRILEIVMKGFIEKHAKQFNIFSWFYRKRKMHRRLV